jgi:hypothetical protein
MQPDSVLFVTPRWTRNGGVAAHAQGERGALRAAACAWGCAGRSGAIAGARPGRRFSQPALFDTNAPLEARLGEAAAFVAGAIHLHQIED